MRPLNLKVCPTAPRHSEAIAKTEFQSLAKSTIIHPLRRASLRASTNLPLLLDVAS